MKRLTCILAATLLTLLTASAGTIGEVRAETDTLTSAAPRSRRTKQRFLPTRQRMDREINKIKFAYRGEVMLGMTASYGTLTTDDADMWTLVSNLSADGAVASIRPFVGYFYKDNRCLGAVSATST